MDITIPGWLTDEPRYVGPAVYAYLKLPPDFYRTTDKAVAVVVTPDQSFLIPVIDGDHNPAGEPADCEAPESRDPIETDREMRCLTAIETVERLASRAGAILAATNVSTEDAVEHTKRLLAVLVSITSGITATEVKDQRVSDAISRRATAGVNKAMDLFEPGHKAIAAQYSRIGNRYHS